LIRTCRRAALALALLATPVAAAGPYAPPDPDVLSALKHHHSRHAWWRVSLDSVRYQVRVHKVDASGVSGLQPFEKGSPVPKAIAWSKIARIDERMSDGRSKPVYVSRPLLEPAPAIAGTASDSAAGSPRTAAALDSARADVASTPAAGASAASVNAPAPGEPTRQVLEACQRIQPTSLLRVHADFGLFEGNVAHAAPEGLSGLSVAPDAPATITAPPDRVRWERIDRVELHGNRAAEGAIGGAIGLGVLGAIIGLVDDVATGVAGTSDSGTSPILVGALIGAASGAVLGAANGALKYKWRRIYPH